MIPRRKLWEKIRKMSTNCKIKITKNNKLLCRFLGNIEIHTLNQNDPEIKLELKKEGREKR